MGYGEIPPRTSLRGYWKLGNTNDSSGNGRTLSLAGTAVFVSTGKLGGAVDLGISAGNNGVSYNTNFFSVDPCNLFTLSWWYKLNVTSSTNANARLFEIATDQMHILLYYNMTGGILNITGALDLSPAGGSIIYNMPIDSNWHHFVFIRKSLNETKFYVDGIFRTSASGGGSNVPIASARKLSIGMSRAANACVWGKFDEFIIDEREWTDSEIRKYYTYSQGRWAA